ncbi:sperm acrosome membrane-associated protein 6 isoform X3 [Ailuropoda melanoleuca]|uniref:sperm acrosome membrane-associated protein 6 isoform X3 n=1 Tax=Ailuropoda melanoleuca TaxID=9646 RepID=UPI0014949C11|nr:sperm acrosome membrane-associated protein 6 isoform X3 [Ailuropoda melanoleuca]
MALLPQGSAVPSALVALMVFRAPAWACLLCFTSHKERVRICQIFAGIEGPELEKCEEAFAVAFKGLLDTEINYDERSHLHDAFTQMTHSLQEIATAQGLQEVARRFHCRGCYSTVCDLPLDCPVQDLTVIRGHQAKFSCTVNFQLPKEEITYSWKFAGGVRTQDVSYFQDLPRARGYLARIRPVQPAHRGTFSCVIQHDQLLLARLYFFLNVTGAPPRGETELQVSFREVLRWAPREAEMIIEPWRPSLGELLARPEALTLSNQCLLAAVAALASASATLVVCQVITNIGEDIRKSEHSYFAGGNRK